MKVSYPLLRRVALPLWLAFAAAALAVAPALALLARLAGFLTRRPEPVGLVRLLYVYVLGELAILLAPARSHDHRLQQLTTFLGDVVATALGSMRVDVEVEADAAAESALARLDRPVLVLARHAGAGDSVLLVHLLLSRYGREPGIVMKEILTLDPVVGIVARHLPSALIDGAVDDPEEISEMARGLTGRGALLLFPEGGNFTPARRSRSIDWLRRNDQAGRAARAERLRHTMAPRAGGVLAALEGARGADVIVVAHAGLGHREVPRDTTIRIRLWHVPAEDVPREDARRVEWVDDWWARVDAWVESAAAPTGR